MGIRTKAAVIRGPGLDWEIAELEVDEPRNHEVLIRFKAAGLCHSDEHVRSGGGTPRRYPMVGGHEGAGIIEAVGESVTRVSVGDHVICSFIPVCGHCRYCSTGRQNLCNAGLNALTGCMPDGSFRFHEPGVDFGGMCVLGTFSERATIQEYSCVKIDDDFPFDVGSLLGCGVPTGWGSAVNAAGVRAGDVVVVFGIGGVGINAVQGARFAGASEVVAVDPVPFKQERAKEFGASFATADVSEATEYVRTATWGEMADAAIVTVGVMNAEVVRQATEMIGKASTVVLTSGSPAGEETIRLRGLDLQRWQTRIQTTLFGGSNPLYDIPKLARLYRRGALKLDELITRRYALEEINEGYRDMLEGRNLRGVIVYED